MSEQENVGVVKHMFELVEQGNLPAALNMLAEDVYWQSPVTRTGSKYLTWYKPRNSRKEVGDFFIELSNKMEIERFQVSDVIAQGNKVVVEGKNKGTVKSTGRSYEHDWIMIFELQDGKIIRNQHYYDTMDLVQHFID
ncbi:MAG TPA: nuclear transport factor 2 family protein [Methanobacterium sp.]|nr:nuclear transport factor 2 family protein [Methanobacterium sp.]